MKRKAVTDVDEALRLVSERAKKIADDKINMAGAVFNPDTERIVMMKAKMRRKLRAMKKNDKNAKGISVGKIPVQSFVNCVNDRDFAQLIKANAFKGGYNGREFNDNEKLENLIRESKDEADRGLAKVKNIMHISLADGSM